MVGLSNWAALPTSTDQFNPQAVRSEHLMSRIVSQNRAEQGHRQADAADDGVLPGRFERRCAPVKRDQEHRRQRGAFDRHPHHSQIVGQRHQNMENTKSGVRA